MIASGSYFVKTLSIFPEDLQRAGPDRCIRRHPVPRKEQTQQQMSKIGATNIAFRAQMQYN
jgi:hypothetical protein